MTHKDISRLNQQTSELLERVTRLETFVEERFASIERAHEIQSEVIMKSIDSLRKDITTKVSPETIKSFKVQLQFLWVIVLSYIVALIGIITKLAT